MTFDTLRQLHGLIGQSLETLEDLFSASQLEFPSLDGHFEAEDASEKLRLSDRAVEASNIIVAAAEQLIALVKLPYISLCDGVMAYHLPACLAFAEDANLVEILREAGPAGLHVNAIAAKIGIPSVKLGESSCLFRAPIFCIFTALVQIKSCVCLQLIFILERSSRASSSIIDYRLFSIRASRYPRF